MLVDPVNDLFQCDECGSPYVEHGHDVVYRGRDPRWALCPACRLAYNEQRIPERIGQPADSQDSVS